MVDGEVQEYGGVAAMDGIERLCVYTCARVGYIIPRIAVASCDLEVGGIGVVDGKVKGDEGVATVYCLKVLYVLASSVIN